MKINQITKKRQTRLKMSVGREEGGGGIFSRPQCGLLSWDIDNDTLGPFSVFDKTSYWKISQSLEAARFVFRIVRSL